MSDTPSVRERLARALWAYHRDKECPTILEFEELQADWQADYLNAVDAILTELEEPSEGMLQAIMIRQASPRGERLVLTDEQRDEVEMIVADYKAMIKHIKNGGS